MMHRSCRTALLAFSLLALALGCAKQQPQIGEPPPPQVDVANPIRAQITEYEYFTGRTEAAESVDIRSRVTGYLLTAPRAKKDATNGDVKEGDDVKEGTPLFTIDDSTFQAEVAKAEANVRQYEALRDRLDADLRRARSLSRSRSISQEELDKIAGDRSQAEANMVGAKAAVKLANVNLAYTKINAPIKGRLSYRKVDPGNLVKADDTILTTIVKLDPIHASFDIDERTVLRVRDLLKQKKIESARTNTLEVRLGLANSESFDRVGEVDFVDNQLDPGTGTLRIRVTTPNKDLFLSPGMFIRLQLPIGKPRDALLVPESAIVSKQGQKVVYVVRNEQKKTQQKNGTFEPVFDEHDKPVMVDMVYEVPVTTGQLETEGFEKSNIRSWRVVTNETALNPTDEIITTGLLRVRAGRTVSVER